MPGYNRRKLRSRYFYLIALVVVIADQISKWAVAQHLPFGTSVPVLGGFAYLTPLRNPGGAFGLFQSSTGLLILVSAAVVVAIIILARRKKALPSMIGIALAFQLGGAVGNLADRIRFHYVYDFIDLRFWPVFNFADIAITVGILLLGYQLIFCEGRGSDAKDAVSGDAVKG